MNDDLGLFGEDPEENRRQPRRRPTRARREVPPQQPPAEEPPARRAAGARRAAPEGRSPRRVPRTAAPRQDQRGTPQTRTQGRPAEGAPNRAGRHASRQAPPPVEPDSQPTERIERPVPAASAAERARARTQRSAAERKAAAPARRAEPRRVAAPAPREEQDAFDDFVGEDSEEHRSGDRRRKWLLRAGALVVLLLVCLGVYLGARYFLGLGGYDDYQGSGKADVLIQVKSGQSTSDIAATLAEADVVASPEAFTAAGEDNDDLVGVQPGYYVMKTQMSGKAAVDRIVSGDNRVGELQIRPGSRLDDVKQPDGSVTKGIYSKLAAASCAELNGKSTCVSVADLRKTVASSDLVSLGVPEWAAAAAQRAEPARRIEGLVAPDVYQVRPGDSPRELLKAVLTGSAARLQASGMPDVAGDTGFTPYQVLVMASLIQSEAIESDFAKVSRVTYNRLAKNQKLQFDSTINYVLDRPEIRTNAADRERAGPYNTYDNGGLPPTPIASPSPEAISAAVNPAEGDWMYFVKCETDGTSCFSETGEQHQKAIEDAQARGVY